MGSTNGSTFVPGNQSADSAHKEAIEEAYREHGHDGYNGTITTSSGFRVVRTTPVSWAEAHAIEEERLDNLNKWEEWEAIPIASDSSYSERTITKSMRLDVPKLPYTRELKELVAPLLKLKDGEIIKEIKVASDEPSWRPSVVTPEGERTVTYFIEGNIQLKDNHFDSIAATRAVLTDAAKGWGKPKPDWKGNLAVRSNEREPLAARVVGRVDRGTKEVPNGEYTRQEIVPLLFVGTEIKSRKITVEATVIKPEGTPTLGGWYFYGWAAI